MTRKTIWVVLFVGLGTIEVAVATEGPQWSGFTQSHYVAPGSEPSRGEFQTPRVSLIMCDGERGPSGYSLQVNLGSEAELERGVALLRTFRHTVMRVGLERMAFGSDWRSDDSLLFVDRSLLAKLSPAGPTGSATGVSALWSGPQGNLELGLGLYDLVESDRGGGGAGAVVSAALHPMSEGLDLSTFAYYSPSQDAWAGSAGFLLSRSEGRTQGSVEGEIAFTELMPRWERGWLLGGSYGVRDVGPMVSLIELLGRYATLIEEPGLRIAQEYVVGANVYVGPGIRDKVSVNVVWEDGLRLKPTTLVAQVQVGI